MTTPELDRVLVTGATGLLGSHTTRALLAAGHTVRAFVRSREKARRVFANQEGALELVQGDIGDVESVQTALEGCDALVHSAATVAAGTGGDPRRLIETNLEGARIVLGNALDRGLRRIVHVSSIASLFRGDGEPVTEDSEPQSSTRAYAQSKVLAERYVRELQATGASIEIVYPGAILGPDDPGLVESNESLIIFTRKLLPITSGGIQYVDARDVAVAVTRILEAGSGHGRYLMPGRFATWAELAALLEELTGEKVASRRVNPAFLRIMGRLFDTVRHVVPLDFPLSVESATYVTKWQPIMPSEELARLGIEFRSLEETLRDTIDWLKEVGHL